jgi:ferric-dicitrate binding protein FerR (iron transport regulator)
MHRDLKAACAAVQQQQAQQQPQQAQQQPQEAQAQQHWQAQTQQHWQAQMQQQTQTQLMQQQARAPQEPQAPAGPAKTGLWPLMRRREVWAIALAQYCSAFGFFGLLSWLPSFFVDHLGLELSQVGV